MYYRCAHQLVDLSWIGEVPISRPFHVNTYLIELRNFTIEWRSGDVSKIQCLRARVASLPSKRKFHPVGILILVNVDQFRKARPAMRTRAAIHRRMQKALDVSSHREPRTVTR